MGPTQEDLVAVVITSGVIDERLIQAFRDTPRADFVPPEVAAAAYEDRPLPIPHDQVTTQPSLSARMIEVLELTERWNRADSKKFAWSLFLVAGDPNDPATYFAGFPKDQVSPISCPDNVAFDPYGNLWISTDGNQLGSHDGLFGVATRGERRGELKQFLTVPAGAETCGPLITEDQKTVFLAPQHPGENGTVEAPTSVWPDGDFPRPSVVCAWHKGGRDIGT